MPFTNSIDVMRQSELFRDLTRREGLEVLDRVRNFVMGYDKNEHIINQGEAVRYIGIVSMGTLTGLKNHYDGSVQLLRVYEEGDTVGLDGAASHLSTTPVTIQAETYSSLLNFEYKDLRCGGSLPEVTQRKIDENLIRVLADENIKLMYKVDVLSKRTLRERVLAHLSLISEKRGSLQIDIGMNQEKFAQYLCVNQNVLCHELNKMRREGIIEYKRSKYTLLMAGSSKK